MSFSMPLNEMSFEEKIQAMELLWDDLCHSTDSISSPSWHKKVLQNRECLLEEGSDEFIDWEVAKRKIKKEIE